MNLFPGTAIFAGQKNIYYVLSVVIFALGIGFIISAFSSFISTDLFYFMVLVGLIIIALSIITILVTYWLDKNQKKL